jgi:hypothetical protein
MNPGNDSISIPATASSKLLNHISDLRNIQKTKRIEQRILQWF